MHAINPSLPDVGEMPVSNLVHLDRGLPHPDPITPEILQAPEVSRKLIPCGMIYYHTPDGIQHGAEFRAELPYGDYDSDADLKTMACDEYNTQYMLVIDRLMEEDKTFISYEQYEHLGFVG